MTLAIVTRYLRPTNNRGARVKATAQAGSVTVPWDYSGNVDDNHRRAAEALVHKLGWDWDLVGGTLPDGRGCFVRRGTPRPRQ